MPFDGFISYSHAADGRLAPAVQRGLHRLAKPWHRRRALWIFRDQTGLAVTPTLWSSIQQALDGSQHFVLLASPEAANSPWVNKEIEHWVATKSPEHILPVVTDGEWRWDAEAGDFTEDSTAVPQALRGVFAEEPLYLDLRWARDDLHLSLQHMRFRDAIAQLAAPMHGVSKDELEGEDVRQHRRARRLTSLAAATLVLLTLVTSLTGVVAVRNADRANAAAADARQQQKLASEQRDTARQATDESQRQQENALVQQGRAQAAMAETHRQEQLAGEQQALAKEAAAEAKREQAVAARHRAEAAEQRANAARQQALAKHASEDAERQKANAEQQLARAREQEQLANEATARANTEQQRAEKFRTEADKANAERLRQEQLAREAVAQQQIVVSQRLMGRARAMIDDDPEKALRLGVAAQRLQSDPPTRDQLSHLAMSTHFAGAIADVSEVAALDAQVLATVGSGGTVSLWDTTNPAKPVRLASLPGVVRAGTKLTTSRDGHRLAVGDGTSATVWDVTDAAHPVRKATLTDAAGVVTVALSPDGHLAATSNRDQNTTLWDLTGAAPAARATLPGAGPLTFNPDEQTAVTSGAEVEVWNLTNPADPAKIATIAAPWGYSIDNSTVALSPKLPVLALKKDDNHVFLYDLTEPATPQLLDVISGLAVLTSMAFSPDGRTLAIGNSDGTTALWAIAEGAGETPASQEATMPATGGPVQSMAFSDDGHTLTTAGNRQTATLWKIEGRFARDATAALPGPYPGDIVGLAFGADSHSLIAAGRQGTAVPWDLTKPGGPVRGDLLPLRSGEVLGLTLSPDGRTLAVTGSDMSVRLLDMTRPAEPALLAKIEYDGLYGVRAVTFSPDGSILVIGRADGGVTWWDLTNRQRPTQLGSFAVTQGLGAVVFHPDGHTMAVADGSSLSLWNLVTRSVAERLASVSLASSIGYNPDGLAFSPDGRTLAAGGEDGHTAALWDVSDPAQPRPTATLTGHTDAVRWVAFSRDGHTLATASRDSSAMLWDVTDTATPIRFATFKNPAQLTDDPTVNAAFSPDGRTLAFGGGNEDGEAGETVSLWDATVPKDLAADPARETCALVGRGLNADEWSQYIPEFPYRSTC